MRLPVALACLIGSFAPTFAFDFPADGFATIFNASAKRAGLTTRIYAENCSKAADIACAYRATGKVYGQVYAPKAPGPSRLLTFSFWPDPADKDTPGEVAITLFDACSPDADPSERSAAGSSLMRELASLGPGSDAAVTLRGVIYKVRLLPSSMEMTVTDDPAFAK